MSYGGLTDAIRREAEIVASTTARTRLGTVSGLHAKKHAAKVLIQPEGVESGWLPVGTLSIGRGWGIHCLPNIGDQVAVHFVDGDFSSGVIGLRYFSLVDKPMDSKAGELLLVHSSNSSLRFNDDGSVLLFSVAKLTVQGADGVEIGGPMLKVTTGNLEVHGTIKAGGTITPNAGV
jgi:phage baseplate assembly protein gpV